MKPKVFRFGIAISDYNVILVFSLQNQKQKSFLRAMVSVRLFYDFPSKSVYWGGKIVLQRDLQSIEINIFLIQKSVGRQTNVEQVNT
jgi:hypothetical protein